MAVTKDDKIADAIADALTSTYCVDYYMNQAGISDVLYTVGIANARATEKVADALLKIAAAIQEAHS